MWTRDFLSRRVPGGLVEPLEHGTQGGGWALSPVVLGHSALYICAWESSSSPPAPRSWDKWIVLLSKPLTPFWTEGRGGG